ncbi:heterokaryon incompatibility protein-domain-containing protein [Paraphoma chrysanthemicola]|nr:heterokaryon incompatibility protein-domain-containing protein [Paraphoma chrysanthemicola]
MMARQVGSRVDFSMVRQWLTCCTERHNDRCDEMTGQLKNEVPSPFFMVIDVDKMCLEKLTEPSTYITLSYVWGANGENSFLTLKSNVNDLLASGSLDNVWNQLPKTIQDSITVVKAIGHKYLWIDSLCIVQDDPESKEVHINSMDTIYSASYFSIIAASGDNAGSGLPGVGQGSRRRPQRRFEGGSSRDFILVDDVEVQLKTSPWVTRGWTYQEWFLSSRCLIFLESQVVFSCRYATFREDIISEDLVPKWHRLNDVDFSYLCLDYELRPYRRYMLQRDLRRDLGDILMLTIREFLERKLTYDDDVLNAFQGVLRDFATLAQSEMVQGTIVGLLDWAILFETHGSRRRTFPSWTWCAWTGLPNWITDGSLFEWIDEQSWIVWHYRGIEATSIVNVPRGKSWQWSISREKASQITDLEDWNDCTFALMVHWHVFKHDRKIEATAVDLDVNAHFSPSIAKNKAFLQFWSFSLPVTFTCTATRSTNKISVPDLTFFDVDGVRCGEIQSLDTHIDSKQIQGRYEVVVLSESNWAKGSSSYVDHKDRKTVRESGRRVVDGNLNVMLVEWHGMIAERIGVGRVWKETVNYLPQPGLVWKEFILG